ncbi:MAG: hypothetical protein E6G34_05265 [Actinobacteria bacterium]|nr:MAG: hypothetical protein E6G34_05265 [Actinomycetota bacterium]
MGVTGRRRAARAGEDECATLRLVYEGLCSERNRLRDARSSFSRQLGPLPVVAGISTGTIAVFARHVHTSWLLWVALGLLAVLVVVSILYSSVPAYRQIRARKETGWRERLVSRHGACLAAEAAERGLQIEDLLAPADWYRAMIELEREIYGRRARERSPLFVRPRRGAENLQDALDSERAGLYAVQFLFGLVIVALALTELIG